MRPDTRGQLKPLQRRALQKRSNRFPRGGRGSKLILFEGVGAGSRAGYNSRDKFKFVSKTGYFSSLPLSQLRLFIDKFALAQREMGR